MSSQPTHGGNVGGHLSPPGDCRNCGGRVPAAVTRIAGDNDGRVEACARCAIPSNRDRFGNHAAALVAYRRGRAELAEVTA